MSNVNKLFKEIVKAGMKKLDKVVDIKYIKKRLKKRGISKTDIEISLNLMACMFFFDSKIFPKDKIGHCSFCQGKSIKDFAAYNHPSDGNHPLEMYEVRVRKLFKDIKKHATMIVIFDKLGNPVINNRNKSLKISYKYLVLSIAVHEVRHRLQKNKIKMFTEDKEYTDPQIISLIKLGWVDHSNAREFDASLVAALSLWIIHDGTSKQKLCKIIKSEG